jgi:hypothetical protein
MAADASAYAVLGLDEDADWPAVERAYKLLIKTHHPDRAGGDPGRAAEINRAYRELRHARSRPDATDDEWLSDDGFPAPARSYRWLAAAGGVVALALLLLILFVPIGGLIDDFRTRALLRGGAAQAGAGEAGAEPMAQPLDGAAIATAVASASRLGPGIDEAVAAQESRACHARLHVQPSLAQLDRCAAFDDAIVELQDRDPLGDDGPFGQVAVTGRLMSGAGLLSDDFVAIDGRLDRIRRAVRQALAPAPLPPIMTNRAGD